MYKLYVGLEHEGKHFNQFKFKDVEGGLRSVLNIKAPTITLLMFKFMQAAVTELYDKDGNVLELTSNLYGQLSFIDGFAIGRAAQKHFTGEEYPEFYESLLCNRCSKGNITHYVTIKESWDKLIEKGEIEEIFLDDVEKSKWVVTLQEGLEISGETYHTLYCKLITFDDMLAIADNPEFETEIDLQNAVADAEIYKIDGMDEQILNMEKRKAGFGRFLSRYVKNDTEWSTIEEEKPKVGLFADFRVVRCDICRGVIEGYDLRNFFFYLTPTQNRGGRRSKSRKKR